MAGTFTAVDLSQLPAPQVVEEVDFETIFSDMLADLIVRDPTFSALVESDPAYKILEVCAFREALVRQRANDSAKAVMLAYAVDTDLDQVLGNFNVSRLLIQAGNPDAIPPTDDVYESDDDFRRRGQLSTEGYTTAGSIGAYLFHALSASADVLDAGVDSLMPGTVSVAVMSRTGTGEAPVQTLEAVVAALNAEKVRPLCDTVRVESVDVIQYAVDAVLITYPGTGQSQVVEASKAALVAHVAKMHRIGLDVTRAGITAALYQSGVQNVILNSPSADIVVEWNQAAYCADVSVSPGGFNE